MVGQAGGWEWEWWLVGKGGVGLVWNWGVRVLNEDFGILVWVKVVSVLERLLDLETVQDCDFLVIVEFLGLVQFCIVYSF